VVVPDRVPAETVCRRVGVGATRVTYWPELGEYACTGNDAAKGDVVGAVEGQRAVVGDVAARDPVVPPLPICSVPAEMVVPPE